MDRTEVALLVNTVMAVIHTTAITHLTIIVITDITITATRNNTEITDANVFVQIWLLKIIDLALCLRAVESCWRLR